MRENKSMRGGLVLILVMGVLAWLALRGPGDALAQGTQPTPDPALAALQSTVAAQQVQIESLKSELDLAKKNYEYELRDQRWKLDQKITYVMIFAAALAAVFSFAGFNLYKWITAKVQADVAKALSQQLYRLDPSNLEIRVPKNAEMQREWIRLTVSGFKHRRWYTSLDQNCRQGVTIVRLQTEVDTQNFVSFIERNCADLDPTQAGFVLYTPLRLSDAVINCYDNLGVANLPTQIISAVMAVGRGITPVMDEKKETSDQGG